MTTTVFEKASDHVADSARKVVDAMKDHYGNARQFVRETEQFADDLYDTTTRQIQRHPAESVTMTFLAGFGVGMLVAWLLKRK